MANKYSPEEIVSSIFKHFPNEWLSPEFIRDETNRVCDALADQRSGDPGRAARDFATRDILTKDNPLKASKFLFNPSLCDDHDFLALRNVYELPEFNQELYKTLVHMNSLREQMLLNPNSVNQIYSSFGLAGNHQKTTKSFTPVQLIYYGVPGCGKSHKVVKEICEIIDSFNNSATEKITYEKQVTRVVFHPDYCNADFIGQIVPVLDSEHHVKYEFKAGPFTQILRKAYLNPSKPYFLVIEEINRGNAAAIFGDVFQLLDRFKSGEHSKNLPINNENFDYAQGWSKYAVANDDINGYVRQGAKLSTSEIENVVYDSDFSEDPEAAIKIPGWGDLHFSVYSGIRLPPNLSIYATMNTSDQNVFTLDNAFKRRFDSELIKNSLEGDEHKAQRETKIEGTDVTWGKFWKSINDLILEKLTSMTSSEDKRLGAYFIEGEEKSADGVTYREISKKLFGEKVLEYLWDDVFKFNKRKEVFQEDCKSVESLIEKFTNGGFTAVFKNLQF